jgi:hypothetical protein
MPERIITSGCEGNHFSIAILFWDFHRAQATPAKKKRPCLYDIFSLLDNQIAPAKGVFDTTPNKLSNRATKKDMIYCFFPPHKQQWILPLHSLFFRAVAICNL